MKRSEKALKFYAGGYNCAQSVIVAFADILKLPEETALRLAAGFGGGMGRMQQTCGAITGAFMVIGYLKGNYQQGEESDQSREITNQLIQDFSRIFIQKHGSTNCKSLIGIDLNTPEGARKAKATDVFNTKCTSFIQTAVELLEETLINDLPEN
ncbi:MAG: C-GCAxxG-C-C family protein [Bacteroidales bacterium]|jgi:C_GCAxxG_C_C family probable redox protein|nr:C-GCAxxG-C-C family protein [Bacteroidales bacterium]